MASAVVTVIEAPAEQEIYMASDDEPVTYNTFFSYLCTLEGTDAPRSDGPVFFTIVSRSQHKAAQSSLGTPLPDIPLRHRVSQRAGSGSSRTGA
jgi:hypothetical protein